MKADKKQGVGTLTYCLTVALDYYAIKINKSTSCDLKSPVKGVWIPRTWTFLVYYPYG